MEGYDTVGDAGLADGSQVSTSAPTNDPTDLSLAGGEGTPDTSLADGEGTPDPSVAEGEATPDPSLAEGDGTPDLNVVEGDGTPDSSLAEGDATPDPHPLVAVALSSDAVPDIEPLSGVTQGADGVLVTPEDRITGPPADVLNDPELLKAWDAMSQGIDDAQAGAPFNPPVDLTGDQTTAAAYELGYRTTTGEWQLPGAAPGPDFSNMPEIRPSTPSEIHRPRWDGVSPQERREQRIRDWLGEREDPHLHGEAGEPPLESPPGISPGD
jgi:hypothetical protein